MTLIFSQKTLPELAWCQPHNLMNICSCKTKWIIWIAICHLAFVILCCLTNVWNSKPINIRHFHTHTHTHTLCPVKKQWNAISPWKKIRKFWTEHRNRHEHPAVAPVALFKPDNLQRSYQHDGCEPVTWTWLCPFKFHHFEGVICIPKQLAVLSCFISFSFFKKTSGSFHIISLSWRCVPQSSPSFCRSVSLRENKDMENTQPFRIATSSKTAAPVGMADRWAMRWQERPKVEVIAPAVCKAWWFV